jgi:enoyl-CoA hydratase
MLARPDGRRAGVPIRTSQQDRVLTVTLDNGPRHFQDRELMFELHRLLGRLRRDRSVGAVVITGAHPRSFLTHYDVAEILAGAQVTPNLPPRALAGGLRAIAALDRLPGTERLLRHRYTVGFLALHRVQQVYLGMNNSDKVFIAAVNGTAAAGGCELALACDIRLMAEGDFTIGLTEPTLGFNPGGGGGQRLSRFVGAARALEMLLEARHLSPQQALEAGLVHRVVKPDQLLEQAQATAQRLARRAPRAIWACKQAAYRAPSERFGPSFRIDQSGFGWGLVAPATQRAMQTMLDQYDSLPASVPSPWHDPDRLREWQEGTAASFDN